ncbi:MAG: dihydrolipoyl dehydrogenase [Candidatus Omnitrophota bacterium]|nr:dihydrolipoyl dehydrogenase [Candidatus Omnitrophota bacterium]
MFDLCVIGSGWAGFNAALRAAELGAKVCLIEQDKLGGVCLNYGCIPTKAMINSSRIFSHLNSLSNFGIEIKETSFNFDKIQEYKLNVVERLKSAINFQLKNKGIEFIKSKAKLIAHDEIAADDQKIKAKNIIIATGSLAAELPSLKFDGKRIVSSNEILELKSIPKTLLIVGGGAIGCEFASIFSSLGSKVTVVELLDRLLPLEDRDISQKLEMVFRKKGIKVLTKTKLEECPLEESEKILVCVGRRPNIQNLGLEELGIKTEKNRICVNNFLQTNIPNIYAAGDCVGKKMLAHVASYEAIVAAENIFASKKEIEYWAVPNCIFCDPEIGTVGLTEDDARNLGRDISISKFSFLSSGMAQILGETDGFIKIICDSKTYELLGAAIIGPKAAELIATLTLAIRKRLKIEDIHDTIFAHPTLSEAIFEAVKGFKRL